MKQYKSDFSESSLQEPSEKKLPESFASQQFA